MKKYSPDVIANAFLYRAREQGKFTMRGMTHMKLQKLVYFMHVWGLVFFNESPVNERPEAWEYGPVFSSLFHLLKTNGSRPVQRCVQMDPDTGEFTPMIPAPDNHEFWELLDRVWERYGEFDAMELSALAHQDDSPWAVARKASKGFLDDEVVKEHYRQKLDAINETAPSDEGA